MVGLLSPQDGDVPLFLRPRDGNSSDQKSSSAIVTEVMTHLRESLPEDQEARLAVLDSGGYSQENMKRSHEAKIRGISRVPETSSEAKRALQEEAGPWQVLCAGSAQYRTGILDLPQGKERWVIVRTEAGEQAKRGQREKKLKQAQAPWEKKLWHLSTQEFACQPEAESAWNQALKGQPSFLVLTCSYQHEGHYQQKGRPKKDAPPDSTVWQVQSSFAVDQEEVERQIKKQACFMVAPNVLDEEKLSHSQVSLTYKEQGGVERGFRFLKDPLFRASSVFVKKPERVMALRFIMVLCLLVYRLAEHVLRRPLQASSHTVPNQVNKPTDRPTMRWIFQCVEGIDLLPMRIGSPWQTQVLGLPPLHHRVLRLLGSAFWQRYFLSP